jgi:hypothetical protein
LLPQEHDQWRDRAPIEVVGAIQHHRHLPFGQDRDRNDASKLNAIDRNELPQNCYDQG